MPLIVRLIASLGFVTWLAFSVARPAPAAAQDASASPDNPACATNPDGASPLPPLQFGSGDPASADFRQQFRQPLPPTPQWSPPGPKRVGLQAGHWLTEQSPPELANLQAGSYGGGESEWQVNLDIAQRTAALLEASGIAVDVLPATVPTSYRANAFLAIHADGDTSGDLHGFKVARPGFSSVPDTDDRLVADLSQNYAADTGVPEDSDHVSLRMLYYYAFNSRRYCHAVATGVPQAIIEAGYLTSPIDRTFLIGNPDVLAQGIADGLLAFLGSN